jgi:hypothetical protein
LEGLSSNKGKDMANKSVPQNASRAGTPLITSISKGCKTPILKVKFCNLVNPFRYPNSPTIPRYSVTCVIDPEKHKEFLNGIQTIEKDEKVESIIKNDTAKKDGVQINTGNLLIKFQTKDIVPVYKQTIEDGKKEDVLMALDEELSRGVRIVVVYDIMRYTKKNTVKTEHGLNFKPCRIYYYGKDDQNEGEST